MSVRNLKLALYDWAVMAFGLFLLVLYFRPKSYSEMVPFRTVSVVAQTAGTRALLRNIGSLYAAF